MKIDCDTNVDYADASNFLDELHRYESTKRKYDIRDQIADGGVITLYEAYDNKLKRPSVLKILRSGVNDGAELMARFVEEARITGGLQHPNIVPVSDIGILDDDTIFFSMKYIDGVSLEEILQRVKLGDPDYSREFSLFSLLTIFRKICDACSFAHSKGVLHRDIKPGNIMVGKFGEVFLVDWGLAEQEERHCPPVIPEVDGANGNRSEKPSRDRVIEGSPFYLSPEQASGQVDRIDRRTDIFQLGATLYSIATLNPPYFGDNLAEIVRNCEIGNFPDPDEIAPERHIPRELRNIIMRAMAVDPDDRYQSVEEIAKEIDDMMECRTICEERLFPAGDMLMREQESGTEAYVIISGCVRVFKSIGQSSVTLAELRDGDCVGEMALISNEPRCASVIASEDTRVVVITQEIMNRGLHKLPPWLNGVLMSLVDRLRSTSGFVHPLMTMDCTYHVIKQFKLLYPFMARTVVGIPQDTPVTMVDCREILCEICQDLMLPVERVANIIASLVEIDLLEMVANDFVTIRDYGLYARFAEFVGRSKGIRTTVPRHRGESLHVNRSSITLALDSPAATVDMERYQSSDVIIFENIEQENEQASEASGIVDEESAELLKLVDDFYEHLSN